MRPVNHRLHGNQSEIPRNGNRPNRRRPDYRHLRSVCGLAACKPWPLQFTPAFTRDRKALSRLKAPSVGQGKAVRRLRAYWSRLGFWPRGETGIYLLGMTQRESARYEKAGTLVWSATGLADRRVC